MRALFSEVNPQPIPCPDLRLPLVNVSDETHKELVKKMLSAGYQLRAPEAAGAGVISSGSAVPSGVPVDALSNDELL